MKKLILAGLLGFCSYTFANVNAVVSILPQQTFLKAIGGNKVNISVMVKPGNSPHTYEPKPSQMRDISKADIYFAIDVEFEKVWLPKFINQNQNMLIANLSEGITKVSISKHSHHHDSKHNDTHASKDPHIWTSPANVKVIAKNILKQLIKIDKINQNYYKKNYEKFISSINQTNNEINDILKDIPKGSKFIVFHPAWGYFAQQYNLEQIAIEVDGKNPKPKQISYIIEEAKEENVKAIFTAPEFSTKVAKQIAHELYFYETNSVSSF